MVSGKPGIIGFGKIRQIKIVRWWVIIFMELKIQKPFTGEL